MYASKKSPGSVPEMGVLMVWWSVRYLTSLIILRNLEKLYK